MLILDDNIQVAVISGVGGDLDGAIDFLVHLQSEISQSLLAKSTTAITYRDGDGFAGVEHSLPMNKWKSELCAESSIL